MLEYDRTDVSEGIDGNKTSGLGERIICHYWYFIGMNFRFKQNVCDGCHYLRQKVLSFNDAADGSVKGNDYRIHFWYMSKDEAMNL